MKIERIELKNIKCFDSFDAHFGAGINFISGRNGAGKTTLVETLGHVLFGADAQGRFLDYFLRHGTDKGEMRVTFSHAGESYTVSRILRRNAAAPRRVFDANGDELSLHGERDVNDFLKQLLRMDPRTNLPRLFNEVIGVRQGTLTSVFHEAASERKRIFNAMLGVDRYKQAAMRMPALSQYIRARDAALNTDIQVRASHTQDLEEVRAALKDVRGRAEQLGGRVEQLQKASAEADAALERVARSAAAREELRAKLFKEQASLAADRKAHEQRLQLAQSGKEAALAELAQLENEIDSAQKELEAAHARMQQAAQALADFSVNERIEPCKKEITACEARRAVLAQRREQLDKTAAGICPLLETPCEKIDFGILKAQTDDLAREDAAQEARAEELRQKVQAMQREDAARRDALAASERECAATLDRIKTRKMKLDARLHTLKEAAMEKERTIAAAQAERPILDERAEQIRETERQLALMETDGGEETLSNLRAAQLKAHEEAGVVQVQLESARMDCERLEKEIVRKETLAEEMARLEEERTGVQRVGTMSETFGAMLRGAGERVAAVYREKLGREANRIHRAMTGENAQLTWQEDYDIVLTDVFLGRERVRTFRQLSGGEQMSAALAIRLALLKELSTLGLAVFDEPTANLDAQRREGLAQMLRSVTGDFSQVFVISHDDTFDAMSDSVLEL